MFLPLLVIDSLLPFWALADAVNDVIKGKEIIWEIDDGIKYYSDLKVFDPGPMPEDFEFIIPDQLSEEASKFPMGMAGILARDDEERCFPVKILIQFSLKQNYANSELTIGMTIGKIGTKAKRTFIIQLDSLPPYEITDFGWISKDIPCSYIMTGDHTLSLEMESDDAYVYFDYLRFSGYPDTDQDGICDQDEGDMDSDNDDLADWQDADCTLIPIPSKSLEKLLVMVRPKDAFGESPSPILQDVSISDIRSITHDPNAFLDIGQSGIEFIYGLIFCRICDIGAGGGAVLILSPPELYGMEQVLAKDAQEKNWIYPNVNIDMKNNQLQFSITDGGPYDIDPNNGHVSLCFGVGIPERLSPYSTTACFIRSLMDNE